MADSTVRSRLITLSFLTKVQNGQSWMDASGQVAHIIYNKPLEKASTTYKAASIRFWATHFLLHGEFPTSKQGCHAKILSVGVRLYLSALTNLLFMIVMDRVCIG